MVDSRLGYNHFELSALVIYKGYFVGLTPSQKYYFEVIEDANLLFVNLSLEVLEAMIICPEGFPLRRRK